MFTYNKKSEFLCAALSKPTVTVKLSQLLLYNHFLQHPVLSTPSRHSIQGKNDYNWNCLWSSDDNLTTFAKHFKEVSDKITLKENKLCYLMDDSNVNLMNYQTNNLTNEFLYSMYSNLLRP